MTKAKKKANKIEKMAREVNAIRTRFDMVLDVVKAQAAANKVLQNEVHALRAAMGSMESIIQHETSARHRCALAFLDYLQAKNLDRPGEHAIA